MAQSRLAVSISLIHEWLHLPPDTRIVGAQYSLDGNAVDLILEGDSVPDAERVRAIVRLWHSETELEAV